MQIEIGLGNRVWVYGKQYEAVKDNRPSSASKNCDMCALHGSKMACYYLSCHGLYRHDGISIHFEEVKGEQQEQHSRPD